MFSSNINQKGFVGSNETFFCPILATDYTNFHGLKCVLGKLGTPQYKRHFCQLSLKNKKNYVLLCGYVF